MITRQSIYQKRPSSKNADKQKILLTYLEAKNIPALEGSWCVYTQLVAAPIHLLAFIVVHTARHKLVPSAEQYWRILDDCNISHLYPWLQKHSCDPGRFLQSPPGQGDAAASHSSTSRHCNTIHRLHDTNYMVSPLPPDWCSRGGSDTGDCPECFHSHREVHKPAAEISDPGHN